MKRNFIQLLVITSAFCTASLLAQIPSLTWVKKVGGKYDDRILDVKIDSQKNVIMVGQTKDTVDYDPGPGVSKQVTLSGGFVWKLDSMGNFIWAKTFNGTNYISPNSLQLDNANNVYIGGGFSGVADFDPGASTFIMTSGGAVPKGDIFAVKLTSAGNFVWAKSMGSIGNDNAFTINLDNSNNIYLNGLFQDTVDFDPGVGTYTIASGYNPNSISSHSFYMKLDNNGNFLWAGALNGTAKSCVRASAIDANNNVYFTGDYAGITDFDMTAGTYTLNGTAQSSAFISKYSATGTLKWVRSSTYLSGPNGEGDDIALDKLGNIFVVGTAGLTINFSLSSNTYSTVLGGNDAFITKFDTAGNYQWLKGYGAYGTGDYMGSIVTDKYNDLYITGSFGLGNGNNDFDPDAVGTYSLPHFTAVSATEGYMLKLDNAGNFKWAFMNSMTTPTITQQQIIQYAGTVDNNGNVYCIGGFNGPADWNPSAGTFTFTTLTNQPWDADGYIQKLSQGIFTAMKPLANPFENASVFPNPTSGRFNIVTKTNSTILVTDIFGREIISENIDAGRNSIDLSSQASGIYFVKAISENGQEVFKLIKE